MYDDLLLRDIILLEIEGPRLISCGTVALMVLGCFSDMCEP